MADLQRQIKNTPSAGICVDRSDHASQFRRGGDDGISWWKVTGGITSSLLSGWREVMGQFSTTLHSANQALFLSTTQNVRLDLMRGVDGLYDEFGDAPQAMMALGLLSTDRPAAYWNHNYLGNLTGNAPAWPGEAKRR